MKLVEAGAVPASASTTAAASSTRSRTAARTTTARSASATGTPRRCIVVCPRHGAQFDLKSGRRSRLPAYLPVRTFPVRVEDGVVKVDTG